MRCCNSSLVIRTLATFSSMSEPSPSDCSLNSCENYIRGATDSQTKIRTFRARKHGKYGQNANVMSFLRETRAARTGSPVPVCTLPSFLCFFTLIVRSSESRKRQYQMFGAWTVIFLPISLNSRVMVMGSPLALLLA